MLKAALALFCAFSCALNANTIALDSTLQDTLQDSAKSNSPLESKLDSPLESNPQSTPTPESNPPNPPTPNPKKHSLYQPINISKKTYGAFGIGYSYNHISTPSIFLKSQAQSQVDSSAQKSLDSRINSAFSRAASGVNFTLERGYHIKNIMLGAHLSGTAGQDYSLYFGFRASYLIARYVIPSIGAGYSLQHLSLPNDDTQYNIHGFSLNAALFVNIYRGFGLSFSGAYSPSLTILRKANAALHLNPRFEGYSLIFSFCFYDFSI